MKRIKQIVIGLAVFLVVFAILGFFVLPPILKSILVNKMSEQLHRDVKIGTIAFNPFRFTLTANGVAITERDKKETFVAFRELFLNLESTSLFKRAVIIDEVRLDTPYIHLSRYKDGSYNFSDLIPAEKPKQKEETRPLRFSINNIRILEGKVAFQDGPRMTNHLAEKIRIGLPFVSNMDRYVDTFVEPSFSAVINGTPYHLQGRTKPFETSRLTEFAIKIGDIDIPYYLSYLPMKTNFHIVSALLDVDAKLAFHQNPDLAKQVLLLSGGLIFKDIAVDDLQQKPLVRINAVNIDMASVAPLNGEIKLAKLTFQEPVVNVRRSREGQINLLSLIPPAEEKKDKPQETGEKAVKGGKPSFVIGLSAFRLEKGRIDYEDAVLLRPFQATLADIQINGDDLSTAPGKEGKVSVSLHLPQDGSLSIAGPLTLSPLAAQLNVDVQKLDIAQLQPYIRNILKVRVVRGKASTQGNLVVEKPDQQLQLRYAGKGVRDSLCLTGHCAGQRSAEVGHVVSQWRRF